MSARDKILGYLYWSVPSVDEEDAKRRASEMLDEWAHELAEEIRNGATALIEDAPEVCECMRVAADLIDPEVEK